MIIISAPAKIRITLEGENMLTPWSASKKSLTGVILGLVTPGAPKVMRWTDRWPGGGAADDPVILQQCAMAGGETGNFGMIGAQSRSFFGGIIFHPFVLAEFDSLCQV